MANSLVGGTGGISEQRELWEEEKQSYQKERKQNGDDRVKVIKPHKIMQIKRYWSSYYINYIHYMYNVYNFLYIKL